MLGLQLLSGQISLTFIGVRTGGGEHNVLRVKGASSEKQYAEVAHTHARARDEYNSILDEEHRSETFKRLVNILRKWQAYRNGKNSSTYKTLKESLLNIEKSYNEINSYSILEFNDIPVKALQRVWHELGRVKELEGKTNDRGIYYAIAACKPLLLIWGQTLAFDTRVRENVPRYYGIRKLNFRLSYKQWYNAMIGLSDDLKRQPKCIATIEKLSQDRYGADSPVPYGRYLDIYYWEGK